MSKNMHGKHREDKVLLGAMVEPRGKAIAIVTAAAVADTGKPMSQSDLIWIGIEHLAIQNGVLNPDGTVSDKYRNAVDLAEASVVDVNKANKGTRGGKRGAK